MTETATKPANGTSGLPAIPAAPNLLPDADRAGKIMEAVVSTGDLSKLEPGVRARYYVALCQSLGLNPLTQPFAYVNVQGKLILYPNKGAAEQLGRHHGVAIDVLNRERFEDLWIVTVRASLPNGRATEEIGAVAIKGKTGEDLANALMKAMTKAKRRAVLSLVGLGWLEPDRDPSEGERVAMDRHANPMLSEPRTRAVDPAAVQAAMDRSYADDDRAHHGEARDLDDTEPGEIVDEDPALIAAAQQAEATDAEFEELGTHHRGVDLAEVRAEVAPLKQAIRDATEAGRAEQPTLITAPEAPPSQLWPEVQKLAAECAAAGVPAIVPRPDQDDDVMREWIARHRRALNAKRSNTR